MSEYLEQDELKMPAELTTEPDHLQMLESISADGFMERFEKGVENYKKFQALCFKLTNEDHWLNQGTETKPSYYLESPGAEAMMIPLGISYRPPRMLRIEKEDAEGKYYAILFEGEAESQLLKRSGFFIGSATSRDQFFHRNKNFDQDRDEGNVIKKALSNWEVNVVGRLAGIRRPSVEMLKLAGLDVKKIKHVDYSGDSSEARGAQTISEAQAKRLYAIAIQENIPADRMSKYLAHRGYKLSKDILRRDYNSIVAWAGKGGPDWEEKKPEQPAAKSADPTPGEQNIKNLKERQKEAPPPPAEVEKISQTQVAELRKEADKAGIPEGGLADFLKEEWGCLLPSVPADRFDELMHAITSEILGWCELAGEPGSKG